MRHDKRNHIDISAIISITAGIGVMGFFLISEIISSASQKYDSYTYTSSNSQSIAAGNRLRAAYVSELQGDVQTLYQNCAPVNWSTTCASLTAGCGPTGGSGVAAGKVIRAAHIGELRLAIRQLLANQATATVNWSWIPPTSTYTNSNSITTIHQSQVKAPNVYLRSSVILKDDNGTSIGLSSGTVNSATHINQIRTVLNDICCSGPSQFCCTNLPDNAHACANNTAPASNLNFTLDAACPAVGKPCQAVCNCDYIKSGSSCVANFPSCPAGDNCGTWTDPCGNNITCQPNSCSAGPPVQCCGGGGTANQCGNSGCNCSTLLDGCGNTCNCNVCDPNLATDIPNATACCLGARPPVNDTPYTLVATCPAKPADCTTVNVCQAACVAHYFPANGQCQSDFYVANVACNSATNWNKLGVAYSGPAGCPISSGNPCWIYSCSGSVAIPGSLPVRGYTNNESFVACQASSVAQATMLAARHTACGPLYGIPCMNAGCGPTEGQPGTACYLWYGAANMCLAAAGLPVTFDNIGSVNTWEEAVGVTETFKCPVIKFYKQDPAGPPTYTCQSNGSWLLSNACILNTCNWNGYGAAAPCAWNQWTGCGAAASGQGFWVRTPVTAVSSYYCTKATKTITCVNYTFPGGMYHFDSSSGSNVCVQGNPQFSNQCNCDTTKYTKIMYYVKGFDEYYVCVPTVPANCGT